MVEPTFGWPIPICAAWIPHAASDIQACCFLSTDCPSESPFWCSSSTRLVAKPTFGPDPILKFLVKFCLYSWFNSILSCQIYPCLSFLAVLSPIDEWEVTRTIIWLMGYNYYIGLLSFFCWNNEITVAPQPLLRRNGEVSEDLALIFRMINATNAMNG